MTFEPDDAEFVDIDLSAAPMPETLKALAITTPAAEIKDLVDMPSVRAFEASRDAFIATGKGIIVASPGALDRCGELIDTCIATRKGVENILEPVVGYFHRLHRAFTGFRGDLTAPLDVLEKDLRDKSVAYRKKVKEEEDRLAREAAAKALAEAEAARAREAAAAKAVADAAREAADKAAAAAAEAAAAGDLDAAMLAEADADEAGRVAALAVAEKEAVEAEPLRVVHAAPVAPVLAKGAGGGGLVDKWTVECVTSPADTIKALCVAVASGRDDLIPYLAIDFAACNKVATALKGETRIPGMKPVNNPILKQSGRKL